MVSLLRWTLWGAGGLALILGLLLWSGNGYAYRNLHMILGVVVVVALWALAIMALPRGTQRGLAVLALVWGLITSVVGVLQVQLLPGSAHVIIQLVHLVLGAGAIALGNRLASGSPRNLQPSLKG